MGVFELVKLGLPTLIGMAKRGELRREHLWCAMNGAGKYRDALASGDIADDATVAHRASRCDNCPMAQMDPCVIADTVKVYCGKPFVEGELTCGCLVGIRVKGQFVPGAKTLVGSAECWNWSGVPTSRGSPQRTPTQAQE